MIYNTLVVIGVLIYWLCVHCVDWEIDQVLSQDILQNIMSLVCLHVNGWPEVSFQNEASQNEEEFILHKKSHTSSMHMMANLKGVSFFKFTYGVT